MRVLLLYDYLSEVGGVERVMARHARWIQEAGHSATLAFSHVNPAAAAYDFFRGLEIVDVGPGGLHNEALRLGCALMGFNRVGRIPADLILAYSFPSLFTVRRARCPLFFYYLPLEFVYYPVPRRWLWANDAKRRLAFVGSLPLAPVIRRMDHSLIRRAGVLANSRFTQREIMERYGCLSTLVYPALDPEFQPAPAVPDPRFNLPARFVLTSGRIVPDKKPDWVIKAFTALPADCALAIAGDIARDFRLHLEDMARRLGVLDRVRFLGRVAQPDLIRLYRAAAAFAFASPGEAFGLAPIEALACGCPVLAWDDNAGPSEYVQSGVNGFLAPPYDLAAFTRGLSDLVTKDFRGNQAGAIAASVDAFRDTAVRQRFFEAVPALKN